MQHCHVRTDTRSVPGMHISFKRVPSSEQSAHSYFPLSALYGLTDLTSQVCGVRTFDNNKGLVRKCH